MAVAQGGWESTAHQRYDGFDVAQVLSIPAAMLSVGPVGAGGAALPLAGGGEEVLSPAPVPPRPDGEGPNRQRKRTSPGSHRADKDERSTTAGGHWILNARVRCPCECLPNAPCGAGDRYFAMIIEKLGERGTAHEGEAYLIPERQSHHATHDHRRGWVRLSKLVAPVVL